MRRQPHLNVYNQAKGIQKYFKMERDTSQNLVVIKERCRTGLISQILRIQEHRTEAEKSIEWARNLQCLRLQASNRKRRRRANEYDVQDPVRVLRRTQLVPGESYVAVSYRWENEASAIGKYEILPMNDVKWSPSVVHDAVWNRVVSYAKHHNVDMIWIDRECVPQEECCEKDTAVQSMDLVYSFSQYSLGLLRSPIDTQKDLELLLKLLRGDLACISNQLQCPILKKINIKIAKEVIKLLDHITSDEWWSRAWIFQEDYRSSTRMCLLIPHSLYLRKMHARKDFGNIPGELQINSANFRRAATVFCLAYCQDPTSDRENCEVCMRILTRAGKYNILLKFQNDGRDHRINKPMAPTIFADIGSRGITRSSDILAIAANCCDYSVRLNTHTLLSTKHSLSLCILVLYLLNGEVIDNSESDGQLLSSTIFEYLNQRTLDRHEPPVLDQELTFLKHSRFTNVWLSPNGINTSGHLWSLQKTIETTTPAFKKSFYDGKKDYSYGLNGYQRLQLKRLSYELRWQGYRSLTKKLENYLREDGFSNGRNEPPSKLYMDMMAEQVIEAIKQGQNLQLGRLVSARPYSGIFVNDSKKQSYCFTSWSPARQGCDRAKREIYKYVSLKVGLLGGESQVPPKLETKKWINGLCFFHGYFTENAVFPWPAELTK